MGHIFPGSLRQVTAVYKQVSWFLVKFWVFKIGTVQPKKEGVSRGVQIDTFELGTQSPIFFRNQKLKLSRVQVVIVLLKKIAKYNIYSQNF